MLRCLAITALGLLPLPLAAGGKKAPAMQVSFHLQTEPGETNLKVFRVPTAGQEITYRLSPAFSQSDFVAFQPFPSTDEATYGVIFQLNKVAAKRLTNLGHAHRGRYLLAMVNGQVRDAVLIDKPVSDGLLVIWQRIGAAEIKLADEHLPRIGQDPAKWKKERRKK
ncbi:MAG: hypothetical protein HKO57_03765 [Akkermansiaceae bacterium]|nr:hypothetical protein [Akkermansiaceae bacterium]